MTGYSIGREGLRSGHTELPTYWICDHEGYPKQVATFYPKPGNGGSALQKRRADALCARLNAEYDEWLRSLV